MKEVIAVLKEYNEYLRAQGAYAEKEALKTLKEFVNTQYGEANWEQFVEDFNRSLLVSVTDQQGKWVGMFGLISESNTKARQAAVFNELKETLRILNVHEKYHSQLMKACTVRDFFTDLHAHLVEQGSGGELQVADMLSVINGKLDEKQNRYLKILGIALVLLLLGGVAAVVATGNVSILNHVMQFLQDNPIVVPIINLARALATGLYNAISTHLDTTNPLFNRVRDNVFTLTTTLTTMTAQSILVSTVGVANPFSAALFIVGSLIDLCRQIKVAWDNWEKYTAHPLYALKDKPEALRQASFDTQCDYARFFVDYTKHKREAFINLATSTILVGAVAVMCLVPGGFMVSLAAGLVMALAMGMQQYALSENNSRMRTLLQEKVEDASMGIVEGENQIGFDDRAGLCFGS